MLWKHDAPSNDDYGDYDDCCADSDDDIIRRVEWPRRRSSSNRLSQIQGVCHAVILETLPASQDGVISATVAEDRRR